MVNYNFNGYFYFKSYLFVPSTNYVVSGSCSSNFGTTFAPNPFSFTTPASIPAIVPHGPIFPFDYTQLHSIGATKFTLEYSINGPFIPIQNCVFTLYNYTSNALLQTIVTKPTLNNKLF